MNQGRMHQLFELGIFLKGALALSECAAGLALAFVSQGTITRLAGWITQHELSEHPKDPVAGYLLRSVQDLSVGTEEFYAFYLVSHGVVKVALVAGLMLNKLWAYPASLVVLGLFIGYQLYRYSHTGGLGLIALTAFDLIVLALIWNEYRMVRRNGAAGKSPAAV